MVIGVHADLVVTGEGIHETKKFMGRSGVHDEIDPWQREAVLRACFVYVSEVNIEPPFAICFFDEYNISQPSGYSTSLIAPAWRSLTTSSLMAF